MESLHEYMNELKEQMEKGAIIQAYQGLMEYFRNLRTHFQKKYPDYSVPSNIYYGYMDMTYFSIIPESLKSKKLKIAIVFVYETFRFEVWLSGVNRDVQAKYGEQIKESGWDKYHLATDPRAIDYILDHVLIENPDFSDLDALTRQIEKGTLDFIEDVEVFLSQLDS